MYDMIDNNRFAYFLNVMHYCIWRGDIRVGHVLYKVIGGFLLVFATLFLTKKYKGRLCAHLANHEKETHDYFYNKKSGFHIRWAHHRFGMFYLCYSVFLSFLIAGILLRNFVAVINPTLFIIISIIPIVVSYIPAYKAVFTDSRYLKYFKQFEKEDNRWHKKWTLITWLFCVGGIVIEIFGIITMMAIVVGGYNNIDLPFLPH